MEFFYLLFQNLTLLLSIFKREDKKDLNFMKHEWFNICKQMLNQ